MRLPRVTRPGKEGVNSGYDIRHQSILDKEYASDTRFKVFIEEDDGEEDTKNLCSFCGLSMYLFEKSRELICSNTSCNNCGVVVNMVNNTPLTNVDQSMRPYQSQHYDPNNPEAEPIFVTYNPDSGNTTVNKNYEVTHSSEGGRIKHIRCRGFPKDISIDAFNND